VRPKRSLGQHFLLDHTIADRVAALAIGDDRDVRVLEVGAGTGALTVSLVQHGARVTALEIDAKLVALLRAREDLHGAEIVEADALRYPYDEYAQLGAWRLAGNLPYNVGTPLVAEIARLLRPPERIVVMLQKDVIDRLVAKPSTPAYGSLTLVVAARMRVRRALTIGRTHFWPQPNVESSVAVLEPSRQVEVENLTRFDEVVKAAFAYRRKTLANSLLRALGAPRDQTVAALEALNLDPETRAEQLDLATFAKLAAQLGR
jgi:16S rRNA (adenine1518-N6/adenine1519-N6)-dimethyltransferase